MTRPVLGAPRAEQRRASLAARRGAVVWRSTKPQVDAAAGTSAMCPIPFTPTRTCARRHKPYSRTGNIAEYFRFYRRSTMRRNTWRRDDAAQKKCIAIDIDTSAFLAFMLQGLLLQSIMGSDEKHDSTEQYRLSILCITRQDQMYR